MNNHAGSNIQGWVPVKLIIEKEELLCRWLYVGHENFTEPFFDETIASRRALPENGYLNIRISNTGELTEQVKEVETIEPAAFIFHISRCGSTLISQMLSVQPANIVLSEVPFFDDLLRYGKKHDCMAGILPKLKAAIGLYGAKRNENQQRLFIKPDSWHIHFYKELRTLYPAVPFFLLYRKPMEVLRSQQKQRGMHAIPNYLEADIFGFDAEKISTMPFDEYMGAVLEGYFEKFVDVLQHDKLAHAINYHNGAMQMIDSIAAVTGLSVSQEEKLLMQERAGYHAKFPQQVFNEKMPDEPIPDFLKKSYELYDKMEQLRLSAV